MIDLHTHSTASDGSYTPTELINQAAKAGVTTLALTDHDTLTGLAEAKQAATHTPITFINGIEISANWQHKTLHIIGLAIDPNNQTLIKATQNAQKIRIARAQKIADKLEQVGIKNVYQETEKLAGSSLIGRAHFARMLVEQGYAKNFKQVFKRYMVRGKPGYVSAEWTALEQAIATIHQANGKAILAHPMRYGLSGGQLRKLIEAFKAAQGDAIEIVSGPTTQAEINTLIRLAETHQLTASTGSDFHGPDKPWTQLGRQPALPATCQPVWLS